jgi:ferredoxin
MAVVFGGVFLGCFFKFYYENGALCVFFHKIPRYYSSGMMVIHPDSLDRLFEALSRNGFTIAGPTVRNRTIVYDELDSSKDLPIGWTDEQDGGTYRLSKQDNDTYFDYVVGPQSWKKFLFPPHNLLWRAARAGAGFNVEIETQKVTKYALIGVRPCELKAIEVQDRVFLQGEYADDNYRALRSNALVVAVNCSRAGNTCFCVSMDSGPKTGGGFDLALTEVVDGEQHYFTVEAGSSQGAELLDGLSGREADAKQIAAADAAIAKAVSQMGRDMDTGGIKDLLYDNYEHRHWDNVANRCLTCGNCTMVCPTCFCSTVEDANDVAGEHAERWQTWDSCFTSDFSYIHGGQLRRTAKSRYRQWLTHKLATWQDQFGMIGCVGCGRCITWCPVGIDITEEVRALRTDGKG